MAFDFLSLSWTLLSDLRNQTSVSDVKRRSCVRAPGAGTHQRQSRDRRWAMTAAAEERTGSRSSSGAGADTRRSILSGVLVGIGVAGFVDEAVFHQILHWHHFYDRSTPAWGLVSDGIFH